MAAPRTVPFAPQSGGGSEISSAAAYRVPLDLGLDGYSLDGPAAYHHHPHRPDQHPHQHRHGVLPQQQHHHQQQPSQLGRVSSQPGQPSNGGQFGILAPTTLPQDAFPEDAHGALGGTSGANAPGAADNGNKAHGQLSGKIAVDPPDLASWRDKLFNVDDMIVLTNDQFETYFPHIDNVYSHRSTQRYKRKPFVSHYWDCRMKGRPPGTPKSDDPNKKKRKRNARERDLCDVKIKITEYAPGAQIQLEDGVSFAQQPPLPPTLEVGPGQKFWTIQRVNGNGGNGKGDGVAGPHRHTLARSDEIKKNSVQRYLAKQERDAKKTQKPVQRKATGPALATVKKHSKDSDMKLYAACFCPFSQRVWITLEAKGMAYQYCEIDLYRRPAPTQFLEANPRGLTPAIRQGEWACAESAVILEYLEDLDKNVPLFPTDPRLKANCRLWIDHINTRIVPEFYSVLQAQGIAIQAELVEHLQTAITSLVLAADEHGPYFLGSSLSLVDVHFAPFALRLSRVLQPLCGWSEPVPGTRWHRWLEALEANAHIRATTSAKELYVETTDLLLQSPTVPG